MKTFLSCPLFALCALATLLSAPTSARENRRLPIIDMHLHAAAPDANGPPPVAVCTPSLPMPHWDPGQRTWLDVFVEHDRNPHCDDPVSSPTTDAEMRERTLAILDSYNVIGVTSNARMDDWHEATPDRIIPSLLMNHGFPPGGFDIDPATVERLKELKDAGQPVVIGEIITQYLGIAPDDPRLTPLWALAEELDIPVGIHVGTGPPGAPYLGFANYRARLHSALTMEEVLVGHPRLRVYLMHAGYPMLDDLLAVLMYHPQVHVDVGAIVWAVPREEFYRYLRTIVEAGLGDRVMFGSDNMVWPELIERSIRIIEDAPFLSDQQKRDILYNNAARFLRLDEETIRRHHSM